MSLLSRLREKIKPTKIYKDPHANSKHRDIMFIFDFESWNYMKREQPEHLGNLIGWAKQNLWNDVWAWRILRKVKGYED